MHGGMSLCEGTRQLSRSRSFVPTKQEHRRRVEGRTSDIPGHKMPTWQEVVDREYAHWETRSFVIDTAGRTADESFQSLLEELAPFFEARLATGDY